MIATGRCGMMRWRECPKFGVSVAFPTTTVLTVDGAQDFRLVKIFTGSDTGKMCIVHASKILIAF